MAIVPCERDAESSAGIDAVERYLEPHHKGSWHLTLNNHASTRPKDYGGSLVHSVAACTTFHCSAGGLLPAWRCSLDLPHSFTPCDGRRVEVTGYGNTRKEAGEAACRRVMAVLLMRSPGDVVLRPLHWWISLDSLVRGLPGTVAEHQALPVHVPWRLRGDGKEEDRLPEAEVKERVASLLRLCLRTHGGSFDPAHISRSALGQKRDEEPVYSQLNKLLKP